MRRNPFGVLLAIAAWLVLFPTSGIAADAPLASDKLTDFRTHVNHIIVIYQENWSFDGLYGTFPGANGIANAGAAARQVDKQGQPYATLPQPINTGRRGPDPHFPPNMPVESFDLMKYMVGPDDKTGDLIHRFDHEQFQIDGGKMDKFVAYSDAAGLAMSRFDATDMPEGRLAKEFTLCDNFFHGAFGGSFLNHIWLIAAATPKFPNAPADLIIHVPKEPKAFSEAVVTDDGYAVNTIFSVNLPHRRDAKGKDIAAKDASHLLPNLTFPTIGDRLSEKSISWAWYSGGWNRAMAADPDPAFNGLFQFHHQPFVYFANYADGTAAKKEHLKDETDFEAAVKNGTLPALSFIKPFGDDNEHPGYAVLERGQKHVVHLVDEVRHSRYWKDSVIIITYDENGGRWDHVAPPNKDRWGPGTRVPTIVVSPFGRSAPVDHTEYDTTSILKLIEERYDLAPLSDRDRKTGDMLNAFERF